MLNLESIAIEPDLATKGVWADFAGGRFLLARIGAAYQQRLVELYNQHRDLIQTETAEGNAKAVDIYRQVYAETVLLDWDQIVDNDKNPVKYTPELGMKILQDPRQYELVAFIEQFVSRRSNYQERVEQEVAEDVKDSAVS